MSRTFITKGLRFERVDRVGVFEVTAVLGDTVYFEKITETGSRVAPDLIDREEFGSVVKRLVV